MHCLIFFIHIPSLNIKKWKLFKIFGEVERKPSEHLLIHEAGKGEAMLCCCMKMCLEHVSLLCEGQT